MHKSKTLNLSAGACGCSAEGAAAGVGDTMAAAVSNATVGAPAGLVALAREENPNFFLGCRAAFAASRRCRRSCSASVTGRLGTDYGEEVEVPCTCARRCVPLGFVAHPALPVGLLHQVGCVLHSALSEPWL